MSVEPTFVRARTPLQLHLHWHWHLQHRSPWGHDFARVSQARRTPASRQAINYTLAALASPLTSLFHLRCAASPQTPTILVSLPRRLAFNALRISAVLLCRIPYLSLPHFSVPVDIRQALFQKLRRSAYYPSSPRALARSLAVSKFAVVR